MRSTVLRRLAGPGMALVLVGGGLAACTGSSGESAQLKVAKQFLAGLGAGSAATAAGLTDNPAAARASLQLSLAGLGTAARGQFVVTAVHPASGGATARASYQATWTLPETSSPWTYSGSLPLAKAGSSWQVTWRPSDVYPGLAVGTHLTTLHRQAPRAALLDSTGKPLFALTAVVTVGIEPKLVTDLDSLATQLAAVPALQSTKAEIVQAVKAAAAPTDFVPVITLRRPEYEQIKPQIYSLPGTVFQTGTEFLTPSAHFGQPLLGTVGPATQEIITASHGRVIAGDTTGIGGLQQALDKQLAGTPGIDVAAAPDTGNGATRTLATISAPIAGHDVQLTLDRSVQTAAENALGQLGKAAAIVAVQRSTGRILADANTASTTYDYGLAGAFPPGSTFKLATWTAAFTVKPSLTPATEVPCPASTTVDGRRFVNENQFSYPPIPISSAFGYSCNTSAIAMNLTLPANALAQAARQLGLGGHWTLPVSTFSGSIPAPVSPTERAADAIGQGRVLASPLLMALMASAADGGRVRPPTLTVGAARAQGSVLPVAITDKMRQLMAATVTLPGGTGHALAGLGDVLGKTGTAEYGTANPPRSHAWFAGVRGDIAFAVFIYDGATSGGTAIPVTRAFLAGLG